MARYRSPDYRVGIATAGAYFEVAGSLQIGGVTLDAPTNIQQLDYLGASAAQRYEGRTTFTFAIDTLQYGAALQALRDANRVIADSDDVKFILSRGSRAWVGEMFPVPIDFGGSDSDEVNTVSATFTGRRWLYEGAFVDSDHFDAAETGDLTLTGKPPSYDPRTRGRGLWIVKRTGSTAATATFAFSDGTTPSSDISTTPGIVNASALATPPVAAFDRLTVSGAIGTDTDIMVVYGQRCGRDF